MTIEKELFVTMGNGKIKLLNKEGKSLPTYHTSYSILGWTHVCEKKGLRVSKNIMGEQDSGKELYFLTATITYEPKSETGY